MTKRYAATTFNLSVFKADTENNRRAHNKKWESNKTREKFSAVDNLVQNSVQQRSR